MVAIITAELRQYRQFILITYGIVALVFALPFPHKSFGIAILFALLVVPIALLYAARNLTNSDRLLAQIPVSRITHALARIVLFTIFATGIILTAYLSRIIVQQDNLFKSGTFAFVALYGFTLSYIGFFLIQLDMQANRKSKLSLYSLRFLAWFAYWMSLNLLLENELFNLMIRIFGPEHFSQTASIIQVSPFQAAVFIIAGIFTLIAEQILFNHRSSYLDKRVERALFKHRKIIAGQC